MRLLLIFSHVITPPWRRNKEQTHDIFLGRWPTTVLSFMTDTAYLSTTLIGSLRHRSVSPIVGVIVVVGPLSSSSHSSDILLDLYQ